MDTDIRHELDRSFGEGPAHPSVEVPLAAGRRALRRRRALVSGAAAAVVVVAGAAYAVAGSGSAPDAERPIVAVEPSATPEPWQRAEIVRYTDGELEVRPGVTVHERLPNPFDHAAPDLSDALDVTWRGQRSWVLTERLDGRTSVAQSVPSNGWASFGDWVSDQVAQTGTGWDETMRLTADGQVVPVDGATVLQHTDDPQLGDDFAPPGATTGAAIVDLGGGRPVYFVVWRVLDGELDVIPTPPGDVVGATFQELLTYARSQYASGEGLR